jgi:uncharacterized protein (UPF0303 family)
MSLKDDVEAIANQERQLVFNTFDEEAAWRLGTRLRSAAVDKKLPIVVDIRRFGQRLFFAALPRSTPDNVDWARRKSNVVARFHRSSYGMGLELQLKNTNLQDRFGLPLSQFAAHGGGFPICVSGVGAFGSVTVSGLPQREDHEFVVQAVCAELGHDYDRLKLPPEEQTGR